MAKKYKFIDELKVGDNCYIFSSHSSPGWQIIECKILKIYREYSTWFKEECLVIEYLFNNTIKKDFIRDVLTHSPWIAGPLCADKDYAIKEADKINKSELNKYNKKYINLEKKFKQELEGLKNIINSLNQLMKYNDNL